MVEKVNKQQDLYADLEPGPDGRVSSGDEQCEADIRTAEGSVGGGQGAESNDSVEAAEGVEAVRARLFFPCNREDALGLLGGLCISHLFPEPNLALAVQPNGVAIIEDGLRSTEEVLLHGGREEKFPVLVEVAGDRLARKPRMIEYRHVIGLRFRNKREADEFRFRPVEEFHPEELVCTAEPDLFGLGGEARFTIRSAAGDLNGIELGRVADRVAAGIHSLTEVGSSRPECRAAIAGLFSGGQADSGRDEFSIGDVFAILTGAGSGAPRHARAMVSAFAETNGSNPMVVIDNVAGALSRQGVADDKTAKAEARWSEIAFDVIRNRISLDGSHLSDSGSITLRAGLVAALVDEPASLATFLDAEHPAGVAVISSAAFLLGLKQGLIAMPWEQKKDTAQQLSALVASIVRRLMKPVPPGKLFAVHREKTGRTEKISILVEGAPFVEWETRRPAPVDEVSRKWLAEIERLGLEILGDGEVDYSWRIRLSPQHVVELTRIETAGEESLTLRYEVGEERKPRRPKELLKSMVGGAPFWYPAIEDDEQLVLHCDLLSLPDRKQQLFLARKLADALERYLVKTRAARKRCAPTSAPKK